MMLTELTAVPESALPVTALKDHLRLGTGFADDALQDGLLTAYLRSALASIEGRTGKVLLQRSFEWSLFEWRHPTRQPLPLAPVSQVTEVVLEASDGSAVVMPSGWRLRPDAQRPVLIAEGTCLPAIPSEGAVKIRMLSGFGPVWSDVPADLQQAVLMLAAHFYENRAQMQGKGEAMPMGIRALIEPYRTVRVFMGSKP